MATPNHTCVVSSLPGRTRFRVPPRRRNPQEMERLASGLQSHPDVHSVEYNVQTGSILVHHDPHRSDVKEVSDVLRDLGCVFTDVTGTSDLIPVKSQSGEELNFGSALADLNHRVRELTNGIIDLRFVLPLGIAVLAALQFINYGWQFEIVPWYVLAYFAIDSFIRLNFNPAPVQNS